MQYSEKYLKEFLNCSRSVEAMFKEADKKIEDLEKALVFTGLKDKDGVNINKDDILEEVHIFTDSMGEEESRITSKYVVVWLDDQASYYLNKIPKGGTHFEDQDLSATSVIGNIKQNPELLN